MGKRKQSSGGTDPNAWMVTFSDLLTLLLTFFVLLLSMSSMDKQKLKESFNSFLQVSGMSPVEGEALISSTDTSERFMRMRQTFIKNIARMGTIGSELLEIKLGGHDRAFPGKENELETTPEEDDDSPEQKTGTGDINPEERPEIEIIVIEDKMLVRFPANITFESGQADLKPLFTKVLKVLAQTIKQNSLQVLIEGHTDNRPINTIRYPSNWELSLDRGARVARYLVEECDIPADSVAAAGYAERRPVATNKTEQGRNRNRRVDIILTMPADKQGTVIPQQQELKNHG